MNKKYKGIIYLVYYERKLGKHIDEEMQLYLTPMILYPFRPRKWLEAENYNRIVLNPVLLKHYRTDRMHNEIVTVSPIALT